MISGAASANYREPVRGPSEFMNVSDLHVFSDVVSSVAVPVGIEHSGESFSSSVGSPHMMAVLAGDFKNSSDFSILVFPGSVDC